MIDLIYKTVKPSHLKKIANHTKNEKPNVPSHLHIFGLNFDKANHCFPNLFLLLVETDFQNNAAYRNE